MATWKGSAWQGSAWKGSAWLSRQEEAAVNTLAQPNDLSDVAWTKVRAVVTKDQVGIGGLPNTACLYSDDSSGGSQSTAVYQATTVVAGKPNTLVAYLKKGSMVWARLGSQNLDAPDFVYFDLDNGVVGTISASVDDYEIIDLGSGWYKCLVQFASVTDLFGHVFLYMASADNNLVVPLDGTSNIIVAGIELYENRALPAVRWLSQA